MGTFDILLGVILVISIIFGLMWYSLKPSKCPKCGKRMEYQCRARNGKEITSEVCSDCGYEIILNEE